MLASIFGLDLATGIKDMLFSNGFTSFEMLLKMPPAELAVILGIDLYVAGLIYRAAKKHMQIANLQNKINEDEIIDAAKKNKSAMVVIHPSSNLNLSLLGTAQIIGVNAAI